MSKQTSPLGVEAAMNQALSLQGAGRIAAAEALYRQVLKAHPEHPGAVFLLGLCRFMAGDHDTALQLMDIAIELDPDVPSAHYNRGMALQQIGRLDEAADSYGRAVALQPGHTQAWCNLGNALLQLDRFDEALRSYDRALALKPDLAEACNGRSNALQHLGRLEEAVATYRNAIQHHPGDARLYNNLAVALQRLERFDDAIAVLRQALVLKPDYAEAYSNLGMALHALNRDAQAVPLYEKALAISPEYVLAHYNKGVSLQALGQHGLAADSFDRALALAPEFAEAHNNRGISLQALGHFEEALASHEKAIELNAHYAEAHWSKGCVLELFSRYPEAVQAFDIAKSLKPEMPYIFGQWLHARMVLCDWSDWDANMQALREIIASGGKASNPFPPLTMPLSLQQKSKCVRDFVADSHPPAATPLWRGERYAHERIRIGYFSTDFRNHAVSHLMAGVFEGHDRARFEVFAFSLGAHKTDDMRLRLEGAFERFIDLRDRIDSACAALVRELEIDIAVDLNGYTQGGRPGIFALRPAPIQVNYLGFPGSLGTTCMDYIVADRVVVPEDHRPDYSEKVVYLPHCFMANDASKAISERPWTRGEQGLPDDAFVYCCFNNAYKITPDVFTVWMRLLAQVPDSVLWLSVGSPVARDNLLRAAEARGIARQRIVFAERVDALAEHFARLRLADLFIDTFHYNAHTTASDALWAGLPVLTCLGESFAGRVAASLLQAIDLAELVTRSPAEYAALALDLAADRPRLAALRARLAANRLTRPLFDTAAFTRQLEAAYLRMWERQQAGLPADHIELDA